MSIKASTDKTRALVEKYRRHEGDTASPEVQIALLTARVSHLTEHFRSHGKDHHSRRGLMKLVGRRRSLLDYLHGRDTNAYHKLIGELGIRK